MKLSLCITSYERTDMVLEVFEKVYDHPLIDEIVIVDDASTEETWHKLIDLCIDFESKYPEEHLDKILLVRNDENLGMSRNKAKAVSEARNEWVAIIDSDNILYPEYLDALDKVFHKPITVLEFELPEEVIYHPVFAEPEHDFKAFSGKLIDFTNAKEYLDNREFRVFLNTCNYVVNRDEYLRVYKYDESIKESDTIYFNTLWLEAGNAFYVVPGMRYHHRKHSGSGWLNGDHRYNMKKAAELQDKIKNL